MLFTKLVLLTAFAPPGSPVLIPVQDGGSADSARLQRPDDNAGPTEVALGFYLVDVLEIDDARETFTANVVYTLRWHDPRLARLGDGPEEVFHPLASVWNPRLQIVNQAGVEASMPETVQVAQDGGVLYRQRVHGKFSCDLELRRFPRDEQDLRFGFVTLGYGPKEVSLVADAGRYGMLESTALAGWTFELGEAEVLREPVPGEDRYLSRLDWHLLATRDSGYYQVKVFLMVSLIVFMAWTVFWIDPCQAGPQIAVATASVFSLIAFQLSIQSTLPRVAYLTEADRLLLGSTLLVFGGLAEAVTTARLAGSGRAELARRLDRIFRVAYPAVFVGLWIAYG